MSSEWEGFKSSCQIDPEDEGGRNEARRDSVTSSTSRTARTRTKTGCITCRRRRIKCGEEKPMCGNCTKSRRQCEGYSRRVVFKKPVLTWRGSTSSEASQLSTDEEVRYRFGSVTTDVSRPLQSIQPKPSPDVQDGGKNLYERFDDCTTLASQSIAELSTGQAPESMDPVNVDYDAFGMNAVDASWQWPYLCIENTPAIPRIETYLDDKQDPAHWAVLAATQSDHTWPSNSEQESMPLSTIDQQQLHMYMGQSNGNDLDGYTAFPQTIVRVPESDAARYGWNHVLYVAPGGCAYHDDMNCGPANV